MKNGVIRNSGMKIYINLSSLTAIYLKEASFGDGRAVTPILRHSFVREAGLLMPG
jgi:hypothetical protein